MLQVPSAVFQAVLAEPWVWNSNMIVFAESACAPIPPPPLHACGAFPRALVVALVGNLCADWLHCPASRAKEALCLCIHVSQFAFSL